MSPWIDGPEATAALQRGAVLVLGGVLALLALLALGGCAPSDGSSAVPSTPGSAGGDVVRMWIAPEVVDCVGVGPQTCLQVAYAEGGEPQLFYGAIEGFEYAEGTSYVLDVRVTDVPSPPADGSSLRYELVEVVSRSAAP